MLHILFKKLHRKDIYKTYYDFNRIHYMHIKADRKYPINIFIKCMPVCSLSVLLGSMSLLCHVRLT